MNLEDMADKLAASGGPPAEVVQAMMELDGVGPRPPTATESLMFIMGLIDSAIQQGPDGMAAMVVTMAKMTVDPNIEFIEFNDAFKRELVKRGMHELASVQEFSVLVKYRSGDKAVMEHVLCFTRGSAPPYDPEAVGDALHAACGDKLTHNQGIVSIGDVGVEIGGSSKIADRFEKLTMQQSRHEKEIRDFRSHMDDFDSFWGGGGDSS